MKSKSSPAASVSVSVPASVCAFAAVLVVAVGIDIAKLKFDVALWLGGKYKSNVFENNASGFAKFYQWLQDNNALNAPLCMEATGSYYEALALFLTAQNLFVSVVNPCRISSYAAAVNARNKTDKQDACIIARYCATQSPARWQASEGAVRGLRDLARRIESLQGLERQERNRLGVAAVAIVPSIKAVLKIIAAQVVAINKAIKAHIAKHPELARKAKLLASIPGVGDATIRVVLGEIPASVMMSARTADSYTGIAPVVHESGTSVRGHAHMSKQGSSRSRRALYFPAIVATKHNPAVKVFYERMLTNNLTKKQAVCAAMRKLLHIMVGVLKSGKPFDATLHLTQQGA